MNKTTSAAVTDDGIARHTLMNVLTKTMIIKWAGKPSNYDTHCVKHIWPVKGKAKIRYTDIHDNHIYEVSLKEIESITAA